MRDRTEIKRQMKRHLQALYEQKKITGARFCISWRGEKIAESELGLADYYVDMQSVTKMFTAAAILQLCEQGALYLHDSVAKFISEFARPPFSQITVLQLLTHTSGLAAVPAAFPERSMDWEAQIGDDVRAEWIPAILKQGLFYCSGTRWEYSKAGFCILGELIQRITKQKAEKYIREQILLPCEMKESYWRAGDGGIWEVIPNTAAGLFAPIGELVQFGMMLAAGGVYKGRRVLKETSVLKLEENQLPDGMRDFCWDHDGRPVAYGAGCPILYPYGEGTIYHEGAGGTMLLINRKERLSAAWSAPFPNRDEWCDEAMIGTAIHLMGEFFS